MRSSLMISAKLVFSALMLGSISACTGGIPADSVAQAYNAPGLVKVAPYSRSIFSSHNF